jgi:hypothetical protein
MNSNLRIFTRTIALLAPSKFVHFVRGTSYIDWRFFKTYYGRSPIALMHARNVPLADIHAWIADTGAIPAIHAAKAHNTHATHIIHKHILTKHPTIGAIIAFDIITKHKYNIIQHITNAHKPTDQRSAPTPANDATQHADQWWKTPDAAYTNEN